MFSNTKIAIDEIGKTSTGFVSEWRHLWLKLDEAGLEDLLLVSAAGIL